MTRKAEVLHLMNIIASPREVCEDLEKSPRWLAPFLFMLLSSVAVGWFMIPAVMEPMRKAVASSFGEDAAQGAVEGMRRSILLLQVVGEPLSKLIRWLVLAAIIGLPTHAYMKEQEHFFKKLFSLIAYSETVFILMSIATLLVIYARGIDSIQSIRDVTVFRGLDFFGSDGMSPYLSAILGSINLFSVWYIVILAGGISALTELRKIPSIVVASISWITWTVAGVVFSRATDAVVGFVLGQH